MGLILRGDLDRKVTAAELDANFVYLESISGGSASVGPTGSQGATGPQGIQGPTGPQGPTGSGGSLTQSVVIYTISDFMIQSQLEPTFVTQSFTQSFMNFSMPLPFFSGGITQSVVLDGVYKTSSYTTSDDFGTYSGSSVAINGVAITQQQVSRFQTIESVGPISYLYQEGVNDSLTYNKIDYLSLSSGGFISNYTYQESLSSLREKYSHTFRNINHAIFEDVFSFFLNFM